MMKLRTMLLLRCRSYSYMDIITCSRPSTYQDSPPHTVPTSIRRLIPCFKQRQSPPIVPQHSQQQPQDLPPTPKNSDNSLPLLRTQNLVQHAMRRLRNLRLNPLLNLTRPLRERHPPQRHKMLICSARLSGQSGSQIEPFASGARGACGARHVREE